MSASKSGFLVIWSVQLPRVPSWCPWDSWYWTSTAEFNMGASWWDEGTPLLHVVPYSALKEDLRSGLEALERGTTKSDVFQLLQQHATTLGGLLVEPDDDDCACWITGDPQDHFSGLGVKGLYARILSKLECATKSERKAAAAAEKVDPAYGPRAGGDVGRDHGDSVDSKASVLGPDVVFARNQDTDGGLSLG